LYDYCDKCVGAWGHAWGQVLLFDFFGLKYLMPLKIQDLAPILIKNKKIELGGEAITQPPR